MINHKLDEIVITETIQQAVNRYNIPGGWTKDEPCVSSFKDETIFYKGIMPSEKVLDLPMDCNTLTGSVNL